MTLGAFLIRQPTNNKSLQRYANSSTKGITWSSCNSPRKIQKKKSKQNRSQPELCANLAKQRINPLNKWHHLEINNNFTKNVAFTKTSSVSLAESSRRRVSLASSCFHPLRIAVSLIIVVDLLIKLFVASTIVHDSRGNARRLSSFETVKPPNQAPATVFSGGKDEEKCFDKVSQVALWSFFLFRGLCGRWSFYWCYWSFEYRRCSGTWNTRLPTLSPSHSCSSFSQSLSCVVQGCFPPEASHQPRSASIT